MEQKMISLCRCSIEDFPNELFYEIFNYLDGCQIHQTFSYLNSRFQQLINSSSFQLKMKFWSNTLDDDCLNEIFCFNKQQIYSLNLNESFSLNPIDSLFICLESLRISSINSKKLLLFLSNLQSLPRLNSLTIEILHCNINYPEIYYEIFTLRTLKHFKLSIDNHLASSQFASFNPNKQISNLESLVINHEWFFPSISNMLSYIPNLRHLTFTKTFYFHSLMQKNLSIYIIWPNLTHLSMCLSLHSRVMFEYFEVLIRKIGLNIKVFSLKTSSENTDYLNASRWENLISNSMPQLDKFYLKYSENVNRIFNYNIDEINDFTSSFWIKQKWILEIEINNQNIIFSVSPYKKQWFNQENLSQLNQLILSRINFNKYNYLITYDINRVLNFTQIYHLEIRKENLFIGSLLQITNSLLELQSLKIHSLILEDSRNLNSKEIAILYSIHLMSQIKKISLENINDVKQIDFLMKFSPYLSFFKIDHLYKVDIISILKSIKNISHAHLNSLCFHVPTADEKMINDLNKRIDDEKLFLDYEINRKNENIFFNCNLLK
ncbi:hypothetical protein I4U23_016501 [Adineta vaga]|nr:hypothetical protein I4U23_016501 [Adineta vaga]